MMRTRPIIVGIVGDSAAGKTTMTRGLVKILGADRVAHVCTDDYHRYDRAERANLPFTALHPKCNYIDIMELQLERLHYGQPILKPVYDHATGRLVRPEYVVPREFIIVEGLLGFSTPILRQFYDIKVFLDPPELLRRQWKINRDTTKRGYKPEQVLAELEKREQESREFIRPQREFADIVVQFSEPLSAAENAQLNAKLVLRPTLPHPDLTYLVEEREVTERAIRLIMQEGLWTFSKSMDTLRKTMRSNWKAQFSGICRTSRFSMPDITVNTRKEGYCDTAARSRLRSSCSRTTYCACIATSSTCPSLRLSRPSSVSTSCIQPRRSRLRNGRSPLQASNAHDR
jgi:uridine kinase